MSTKTSELNWDPENERFWESQGKKIASRNLWISVPCLFLSFSAWVMWSAIAVNLNKVGFHFTPEQLFTLTAVPGITGSLLRIIYSFVVPVFGGRNWTVVSTFSLLIPAIGVGYAVQDLNTSYTTFLLLATCCGFGGGNFSSSMANISFFYPKKSQGTALGINAGFGNLGVSGLQFAAPLAVSLSLFGVFGGAPQTWTDGLITKQIWLQNVGYMLIIPIIISGIFALFGMDNLHAAKTSVKEQMVIFKRKHFYITTVLYIMSFGSFIGFSVSVPLLINLLFPGVSPLAYAFWGPLLGGLIRPVGGWLSDKISSGAIVTIVCTIVMIIAVGLIMFFSQPEHHSFKGFFTTMLVFFVATGIANGSVFRMIGVIFPPKEKAPVLGMSAAIAAFGAFVVPKMFAISIEYSKGIGVALMGFAVYYAICLVKCWWFYYRKNATAKC